MESQREFLHFLIIIHPESVSYIFQTQRCKNIGLNANLSFSDLICILTLDPCLNVPEKNRHKRRCLIYLMLEAIELFPFKKFITPVNAQPDAIYYVPTHLRAKERVLVILSILEPTFC